MLRGSLGINRRGIWIYIVDVVMTVLVSILVRFKKRFMGTVKLCVTVVKSVSRSVPTIYKITLAFLVPMCYKYNIPPNNRRRD